MIVIIDTTDKTAKVFTTKSQAAKFMGVSRNTILNWSHRYSFKVRGKLQVYFDCELVKGRI